MVEAIDRKNNFPTPSVRQRKPVSDDPKSPDARSSATESSAKGKAIAKGVGAEQKRIISPELRGLLSRKVEVLDKQAVKEHGGGV